MVFQFLIFFFFFLLESYNSQQPVDKWKRKPDKVHESNYFVKHLIFHIPKYLDFSVETICNHKPRHFFLNSSGLCRYSAAASPFSGSVGLGYVSSCGKNDSKMFARSASVKITFMSSLFMNSKNDHVYFSWM